MCGIWGCSRLTENTKKVLPFLAWEMEDRGRDSWGCTDGTSFIRKLGAVSDSFEQPDNWCRLIGHCRAASCGKVCIANQHPFEIQANGPSTEDGQPGPWLRTVIGIHNGHVANNQELNKANNLNFDCDSPHIFYHIAHRIPTTNIRGYGNLAWYEYSPEEEHGPLHLLRFNNDALEVVQLETGEIIFCSLFTPIRRAVHMAGLKIKTIYKLEEEREYIVDVDTDNADIDSLYKMGEMQFGTRYSVSNVTHSSGMEIYAGYGTRHRGPGYTNDYTARGTAEKQSSWTRTTGGTVIHTPSTTPGSTTSRGKNADACAVLGCTSTVLGGRAKALICQTHLHCTLRTLGEAYRQDADLAMALSLERA